MRLDLGYSLLAVYSALFLLTLWTLFRAWKKHRATRHHAGNIAVFYLIMVAYMATISAPFLAFGWATLKDVMTGMFAVIFVLVSLMALLAAPYRFHALSTPSS